MAKSILIIYAHPSPKRSKLNQHMFEKVTKSGLIAGRDLYELYPNMHIDVSAEQEALRRADAVVFQFPLYWYSSPAILKEWIDTVLKSGFSHGSGERALDRKPFMIAVSTGSEDTAYTEEGVHKTFLRDYLLPLEQTARFCGMKVFKPFIVQGVSEMAQLDIESIPERYQRRLTEFGECTSD